MTEATTRTVEDDARAALGQGVWMTATQVYQRLGDTRWAQTTVRHALRDMADRGEMQTRLQPFNGHYTREYRRP